MNKKQKKVFTRIIVAAVLMVVLSLLPIDGWLKFVLFMIPYLVIGHDILLKAWKGILNRQVFDENFLMAVATIGAILLGDYKEGVAVMLFYQIGELFQSYAVGKSRRNISELMDIRPDYANIEKEDGTLEQVDPDERMILTARYVRRLLWYAMEFHVYFSRRQAIRIHNRAVKKLVGAQVGGGEDAPGA